MGRAITKPIGESAVRALYELARLMFQFELFIRFSASVTAFLGLIRFLRSSAILAALDLMIVITSSGFSFGLNPQDLSREVGGVGRRHRRPGHP
jgi:hypothetical protein